MKSSRPHHLSLIANALSKLCGSRCVAYNADQGRRSSDFLMVNLWGDKIRVLEILPELTDHLRGIDVEIIQSGRRGEDYFLVFAVTRKLATQSVQAPERRAKMRHEVASQARRRVISHHLATASEVKKSRLIKPRILRVSRVRQAVVGLEQKPI
jgi:hypothetical protein